jgi:hypothetical protein
MEKNPMIGVQSAQPNFTVRADMPAPCQTAVAFESTPWLLPTLIQLQQLEESGRNLPGIGDFRISPGTVAMIRILLSRIPIGNLPEPKLIPISGGAAGIVWSFGSGQIDFTVYPNEGHFAYVLTNERDEAIGDGILGFDEQQRIRAIFNSRIV